jgi:predicted amidohydrolase
MRFACVQFDIAWEDKATNHARIERMLDEARPRLEPGAFVLVPELGDTGFSMDLERIADDGSLPWAIDLATRRRIFLQHGFARRSISERTADAGQPRGRNCAVIISPDGEVLADYEKVHPFSYGREADHYSAGEHITIARCANLNVCPFICYDLRFPELWRLAATNQLPAEAFTIGASWPATRQHHWRALCIARAIENQAFVIACNRCGHDPHVAYAGGSLIVAPTGEVVAEARHVPTVLQGEIAVEAMHAWREEFPALRDVHHDLLGRSRIEVR